MIGDKERAKVEAAIIGAGFIGLLHRRAWEANGVRVRVMVDPYMPEQRRMELKRYGVEVADDIDAAYALYPGLAAVSICTPPGRHAEDLDRVLERGTPVLLEKPVSASRDDYMAMLAAAQERKGKIMIGLTQRFYREVQQAATWVRDGRIGRLLAFHDTMILSGEGLPRWYEDRRMSGGGIWITNGVHLLDRLQFILDDGLGTLRHFDLVEGSNGLDRMAVASGSTTRGIPYHLHLEWSNAPGLQRTVIYGMRGRIELQTWQHATLYEDNGRSIRYEPYSSQDTFDDRTARGLSLEVQAFMQGLSGGAFPNGLTLEEHLPTMDAIWEAYERKRRSTDENR